MADYTMYHALGQGEQLDPNDPHRTSQPAPPQFQPPVAPFPSQQSPGYGSPGSAPASADQRQYYGGATAHQPAPGYAAPMQQTQQTSGAQGYFQGQPAQGQDSDLAAQMGGMSLGQESAAGVGKKKKKDRHAYHTVEASGSSQAFNGIPASGTPATAFLNSDPSGTSGFVGQVQPPGSQFPVQVGAQFPAQAGTPFPAPSPQFSVSGGPASPPAFAPAGSSSQVSPDEIPSVPVSRDSVQQYFFSNVYPTFERHVPPPAAISFVAFDQGNSSPKFARLTMNNIPSSTEGLQSTGLPLGLILQPLAPLQEGESPIPVLDFGDAGPPRCRRCRAYINPFMMFRAGGNKFVCNLCTYPNDTPPEYFCATSLQGVRADRDQRPELCRGTVEFVVPKEYWTKEPVGMRWLFVIDVTQESYNKGFLESFCDGVLRALYGGDSEEDEKDEKDEHGEPKFKRSIPPNARVGFVTFDKDVHFYNVSSSLEQAQMMIMTDIEEPFVPLSEGLFVDPYESKAVITSLLSRLPTMFSNIKNPEPALLSTLNSAVSALEKTGGKVICSLSALPTWGPGRLFMRDDGKHPGGEIDKKLFTTEHPAWKKLAEKMASSGIGVDFFTAAPSGGYLDIATVGHVSSTTGGETYYYPNFIAPRDNTKLSLEIKHSVERETGYQALMKVRCSNGLQVSAYHGNFIQHTFNADLEIGVIDQDKAIGISFSYDGKLDSKLDAHFQAALLYTTGNGERRVRCCNIIASVNENPRESMKFVDQDAVYSILAKEAATKLATTSASLKDIRLSLTEKTIDSMAGYRKNHTAQSHPPGQLVMPERLKEFCMYMLALIKCRAFKGGSETSDRRVHEMRMIRSMSALELSLYLYPRMIPIHNLQPEEGFPDPKTGHLRMPPSIRASFSRVETGGVYLVDNGQQCLLWFHAQTSPNLIADLFGEDKTELKALDAYTSTLPVLQTHLNAQVRNVVEFLRTLRGSKGLTIQLARQGIDGAEYEFARMLVEDRNNEAQSYVDWLVHIHKGVQLELTGQRKRENQNEASTLSNFAGLRPAYW